MIKIHMGCGGQLWGVIPGIDGPQVDNTGAAGWINVDADFDPELLTRPHADEMVHGYPRALKADFRHLPMFPDNFADYITSHHSLEHVRIDEALPTLKEWHRVLKPGGICSVSVPDLLWVAERLVETGGDLMWSEMGQSTGDWEGGYTKLVNCVFGDQSNDGYQLHRTGFTAKYLTHLFEQAGFQSINTGQQADMGMRSLLCEGHK